MKCFVVLSVLACLLAVVYASSYASAARGGRRSPARARASRPAALTASSDDGNEQPTPYQFSYATDDGEAKTERQEEGDGSGAVKGSYSIMGPDGIFRTVTYIADEGGFRASISSNEPGLGTTENPADVTIDAQSPPAGAYGPSRSQKKKKTSRNYY